MTRVIFLSISNFLGLPQDRRIDRQTNERGKIAIRNANSCREIKQPVKWIRKSQAPGMFIKDISFSEGRYMKGTCSRTTVTTLHDSRVQRKQNMKADATYGTMQNGKTSI